MPTPVEELLRNIDLFHRAGVMDDSEARLHLSMLPKAEGIPETPTENADENL